MSIVSVIKELCNGKNTNFASLERELGFGQGTIRKWDNSSPSVDKLQKVADYFDISVDSILGNKKGSGEPELVNNDEELTEYLEELKNRPELKMMFQLAKGASKEDVEKAVKIIEAFLKE